MEKRKREKENEKRSKSVDDWEKLQNQHYTTNLNLFVAFDLCAIGVKQKLPCINSKRKLILNFSCGKKKGIGAVQAFRTNGSAA